MRAFPFLSRRFAAFSGLVATLLVTACSSSDDPSPASTPDLTLSERLVALGATPCPDLPAFYCGVLPVPRDHAEPGGPTMNIAFAVRPADDAAPIGPLVIVDGGPGYSGVADADDLDWLDPRLHARFDLVYFDLRGLAGSGGLDCPEATSAYYSGGLRAATPAEQDVVVARAAAFVADCPTEAGVSPADITHLTTDQAAQDIEALRVAFGAASITLYGLSYGTQLSQTYASRYPETTRAVAIDGVVDLTLREIDYATSLSKATNLVLDKTLAACADDPDCAYDLEDTVATYDAVAKLLETAPVSVNAPTPEGDLLSRSFTRSDLDSITAIALDEPYLRSLLMRGLAGAAVYNDFVPLRRLLDIAGTIDAETEAYLPDGFSDAIYYTITCNDYGLIEGGVDAYLARGQEQVDGGARTVSSFFGDLPCTSWQSAPKTETPRPGAFAPPNVPVIVINAEGDVATPVDQGETVLAELRSAGNRALGVSVKGGHHVMWGSDTCVDAVVTPFLLDPNDPGLALDTTCDAGMLDYYEPLSPATSAEVTTALDLAYYFSAEEWSLPYFPYPDSYGCNLGGTVVVDDNLDITISDCAFTPDLTVNGTGHYDEDAEKLTLEITFTGAHTGTLSYDETWEAIHTSGTFDGMTVDESY